MMTEHSSTNAQHRTIWCQKNMHAHCQMMNRPIDCNCACHSGQHDTLQEGRDYIVVPENN
jgi:hypothetical protein